MKEMNESGDIVAVVMAGGAGTRFWPLSTESLPKQFLTAFADESLYQQTIRRARRLVSPERILVMTNRALAGHVRTQSPEIPEENVILEPRRRDTAPAVALAAMIAEARWPGSVMIVMPSDHRIESTEGFVKTVAVAANRARQGGLGTIGIRASFPATGFGYLKIEEHDPPCGRALKVSRFVEKPDRKRAEEFLASGQYLWNAGIFLWQGATLLAEVERHLPALYRALEPLGQALGSEEFGDKLCQAFAQAPSISIDFGVMEKASEVWAVVAEFDWSDVGGWKAARELIAPDAEGNRVRGPVLMHRSGGNMVVAADGSPPVVCAGASGLIIVSTRNGVLICTEETADELKPLVSKLEKEEKSDA